MQFISGNGGYGIRLNNADSNTIQSNIIGADIHASNTLAYGNTSHGIYAQNSNYNEIGGYLPGTGNIISGNGGVGIYLFGGDKFNNISGNFIGVSGSGLAALANNSQGIWVSGASKFNMIGDSINPTGRNIISGNGQFAINIQSFSDSNIVTGNYLGLGADGTTSIPNSTGGLTIATRGNKIGGSGFNAKNIVSGNSGVGIDIYSTTATANILVNNIVGLNASGTLKKPNTVDGVRIRAGAKYNFIGKSGLGNIISGNNQSGLSFALSADSNSVQSNFIGTDSTGTINFGNGIDGITISSGNGNLIGGQNLGEGNIIYSNTNNGILISGGGGNSIVNNKITSNTQYGIKADGASSQNSIFFKNLISKNSLDGIKVQNGSQKGVAPPRIKSAIINGPKINLVGKSAPNASIQIFADSLGRGQGSIFLDTTMANSNGDWVKQVSLIPSIEITALQDSLQNTSAFSKPIIPAPLTLNGTLEAFPGTLIDFGNVNIGDSLVKVIRFTAKNDNVKLNSVDLSAKLPFRFLNSNITSPDTLFPGQDTASAVFSFVPTIAGSFTDTIEFFTSGNTLKVILQGASLMDSNPPQMDIYLLRSTITDQYVDIVVSANEGLKTISGDVTLNGSTNLILTDISADHRIFSAPYRLEEGNMTISITAKDSADNNGITTRNYTVASLEKSNFAMQTSGFYLSGKIEKSLNKGYLITSSQTLSDKTMYQNPQNSLIQITEEITIMTTTDLQKNLRMNLKGVYDKNKVSFLRSKYSDFDESQIGIYHFSELSNQWVYAGGEGSDLSVDAVVQELGKFAVFYNPEHITVPKRVELLQNYPNPFNPVTTIKFGLPNEGTVKLTVYNLLGQRVKELVNESKGAGYHYVVWNGTDELGKSVASGIYLYRLNTENGSRSGKMLLIK